MIRAPSGFSLFCIASILGIWPRFIEPNLLRTTHLHVPIVKEEFKMVQISDLHFNEGMPTKFLAKTIARVNKEMPDLIAITGDFLCNGQMGDPKIIREFLRALKAPLGLFAVLGNHDYNSALGINERGDYDVIPKVLTPFLSGMTRLFKKNILSGLTTKRAKNALPHPELLQVLEESAVTLLNNETVQSGPINLTGLGEWMAGATHPAIAFKAFDTHLPGVILVHNPDAIKEIELYPGNLVLSGHTHGGQINLPWLWRRFTVMENPLFKSGLYPIKEKFLYISRGVGGVIPFRLNAFPEIVSIKLGGKRT